MIPGPTKKIPRYISDFKLSLQAEEAVSSTQHTELQNRLKRSVDMLEALKFYMSCFALERKSLNQFFDNFNKMICKEDSLKVTPKFLTLLQVS